MELTAGHFVSSHTLASRHSRLSSDVVFVKLSCAQAGASFRNTELGNPALT